MNGKNKNIDTNKFSAIRLNEEPIKITIKDIVKRILGTNKRITPQELFNNEGVNSNLTPNQCIEKKEDFIKWLLDKKSEYVEGCEIQEVLDEIVEKVKEDF